MTDSPTLSQHAAELLNKIESKTARIGVIGLGYVGLPLSQTFHTAGYSVLGFDIDPKKIEMLAEGVSYFRHLGAETFTELAQSERFEATTDFSRLDEPDAIAICVPTPIGVHREPDLSYVLRSGESIASKLRPGQLILLESTTYPGTTDTELRSVLDRAGLTMGEEYFLGFSPEREDPGNRNFTTKTIPKLVGGVDPASSLLSVQLYEAAFKQVVPVSSARVAEAAKLMENIYRAVNIALVNELKMVFAAMDIDVWEVLDAASTKPFGFQRFEPGPGWGGHCIPIDPFYLTWKAKSAGMPTHFIERAGEINIQMPQYVVQQLQNGLNEQEKSIKNSNIMLIGMAYKPDIDDTRESPAFPVWTLLEERGANVSYHDPHVTHLTTHRWPHLNGKESTELNAESLRNVDAVIVITRHSQMDLSALSEFEGLVVDTRNTVQPDQVRHLIKA